MHIQFVKSLPDSEGFFDSYSQGIFLLFHQIGGFTPKIGAKMLFIANEIPQLCDAIHGISKLNKQFYRNQMLEKTTTKLQAILT